MRDWLGLVCLLLSFLVADRAEATTLWGLASSGNFLIHFDGSSPSSIDGALIITGLQPGERIAGIDFRPRTGQLYGLGVISGGSDTIRLYTLDTTNGVATQVPLSTPFTVSHSASYGMSGRRGRRRA
jgi:uncharacterized protein DUF4394